MVDLKLIIVTSVYIMNGKFSDFLRHRRKISPTAAIFARFTPQFTPIKTIGIHPRPALRSSKD